LPASEPNRQSGLFFRFFIRQRFPPQGGFQRHPRVARGHKKPGDLFENMDYNIHVIKQNPLPIHFAFLMPGIDLTGFEYFFFNGIGDGVDLRIGVPEQMTK
jgi:hypothetical protein